LQNRSDSLWNFYKEHRNIENKIKRKFREQAIRKFAKESNNEARALWKVINTETGRITQEAKLPEFILENKTVTTNLDKLNELAKHFTKNAEIVPHFTKIINIFQQGIYPDALKTALITPLYKQKGERTNVRNYRPISILSTSTKIIEKLMADKITHYLDQNNLIMQQQHGYRKDHSTQSAITILTDDIKVASNNGKMTGAVFIDFEQAFDNVQHNILLQKMCKYGIRGKILQTLHSYFSNRKIVVCKGNDRSIDYNIIQGIPQGSSLS